MSSEIWGLVLALPMSSDKSITLTVQRRCKMAGIRAGKQFSGRTAVRPSITPPGTTPSSSESALPSSMMAAPVS